MVSAKKISIITPCYNTAETLERMWESVYSQTMPLQELECIFIDDASTDNGDTWQMIQTFEKKAPASVLAIHLEENLRQGGARNVGLQYATGKYLLFLDADDALLPYAAEVLYILAEDYQTDIIQYTHDRFDATEGTPPASAFYEFISPEDRKPFLIPGRVPFGCCSKLYRTELIRRTGARFAEHHLLYEEPPFVYPLLLYADRIMVTEQSMFRTFDRPGSATKAADRTMISEHPAVQLMVLSYCMERPEIMKQYHDEVAFYFLWTFFYETVRFAELAHCDLPEDVLQHMKDTCRSVFPGWRNNPYVKTLATVEMTVFDLIDK